MSLTPLEEVKFALQVIEDGRRILVCNPRDQLVCELAAADFPLVEVRPNTLLDPGVVYLLDPNAMDAELAEVLQRQRPRQPLFPDPTRWYRNWNPGFWGPMWMT